MATDIYYLSGVKTPNPPETKKSGNGLLWASALVILTVVATRSN